MHMRIVDGWMDIAVYDDDVLLEKLYTVVHFNDYLPNGKKY